MSTIFHEGRKLLRLEVGNPNYAEIADLLYFRVRYSKYSDKDNKTFFLLPNIDYISDHTGFGNTQVRKALSVLEEIGFIQKIKHKCFDGAVRLKIYISEKFKTIMDMIENLRNNKKTIIEAPIALDSAQIDISDPAQIDISLLKEQTIKENNIVKPVIDFKNNLNETKQSNLIDITNTPNFTTDTEIKTDITDNQINSISETAKEYKVDPCKLFDSVMESLDRVGGLFDNYNQLLATSINKQLATQLDEQVRENVRGQCKYNIDFNSTELANDDRLDELDKSQQYAIEHNLKYLQNFKGKQFDMSEMKQWVSHSLTCGYKGLGFKKAIRCIVKSIKDDKYTRPWSLKANYCLGAA
jgi:hypothetical protein